MAFAPQERPTTDIPLAESQEALVLVSEISGDVEFGAGAASEAAVGTEVYLQIRRHFELDADAEIVIPTIRNNTFISNRDSFETFIRDNPELSDGSGYEVWLITETSGQKVERPIVKFEITGGRPGPATEELPQTFEPYELKELEFEQPVDPLPSGENGDDRPDAETSQTRVSSDGTMPVGPQQTDSGDMTDDSDEDEDVQDEAVEQAVSGLLLTGFTKAARWRRQVERKQLELRRVARVVRKMDDGSGIELKNEPEATSQMAALHSATDGE